jgi:hypothetical protein
MNLLKMDELPRKRPFKKRNRNPLSTTKDCKGCHRTLVKTEHFYKAGDNTYQSRCKTYGCHAEFRKKYPNPPPLVRKNTYIKKGTGVARLSPDVREQLKNMLAKKEKMKVIATTLGICYPTLTKWKQSKQLENL